MPIEDYSEEYATAPSVGMYSMELLEMGLSRLVTDGVKTNLSQELLAVSLKQHALGMRLALTSQLLADRLPPTDVDRTVPAFFSFPASPFQHWKSKHEDSRWLGWFVRRWPVRTDEHRQDVRLIVHLERFRTYPEARIPVPEDFGQVRFSYDLSERIEYPR